MKIQLGSDIFASNARLRTFNTKREIGKTLKIQVNVIYNKTFARTGTVQSVQQLGYRQDDQEIGV